MANTNTYSEGDSFFCPHCNRDSFVKEKTEYHDFTPVRTYFVCAFCQSELIVGGEGRKSAVKKQEKNALSSLFGEVQKGGDSEISDLLSDDKEHHFCKNCHHHFVTPFKSHCTLHNKEVEPLEDCQDYAPKQQATSI